MQCPKCGSIDVWLEEDAGTTWLRCHCGLMKLVEKVTDGYVIRHRTAADQVVLPRKGTKLHKVFMVVASYGIQSTGDVAHVLGEKPPKVTTFLNMLDASGLLTLVESRRGKAGGSTWDLSKRAHVLLGG